MFFTKVLLILCFVLCSHGVPVSENDAECTPLRTCSHIYDLVKTKRDHYGTITLLFLTHCYQRGRDIYVKCISPAKVKDFMDRANLIPNYDSCGYESLKPKIEGGKATDIDEYPWIALLRYRTNTGTTIYGCHGNIISRRYLLTAAHCVDPIITQSKTKGNIYSAIFGEYDIRNKTDCISTDCADEVKELLVENYHMHPDFNSTNFANDIALVRMERDIEYSDFIKPICLPPKNLIEPFNETLLIAGWGNTAKEVMNPVKVEARFALKEQDSCIVNLQLTSKQFCAASLKNAKTCPGDSGGPLMMRRKLEDGNHLFLIGVDSLGVDCKLNAYISIYTKVSSYIEWIVTTIHK